MKLLFFFLFFFGLTSFGQSLSASEFKTAITDSSIQLLDARTSKEFETGYIQNALQADWNNKTEFEERTKALDKNKPVYIYCLGGGRSAAAQKWMLENGFTSVINLTGGINAWNQAELPVTAVVEVKQQSKKDFLATLPKNKKVLVDFGATWCPPCKVMIPIVDELEKEGTTIVKVDGGDQKTLCKELSIGAFPTFIVFENGKEIKRKQGLSTKEELQELLK